MFGFYCTLLLNDGQGHFTRQKPFAVGTSLTEIHAEDYDGDGRADLLVSDVEPALYRLLLNRGGGGATNRSGREEARRSARAARDAAD